MAPRDKARHNRVLLTFTGFHDPFASTGVAGSEQKGPILSLIQLREFDRVYLFSTPNTVANTDGTVKAIRDLQPALKTEVCCLKLDNPTDYSAILKGLRECFERISEANPGAEYFIATASGTPQMHACWLLLAASGAIPARLLQAHNTKFVTEQAPEITEVDLTRPEFPRVRSNPLRDFESEDTDGSSVTRALEDTDIVGDHDSIRLAVQRAINLAPYTIPVLIAGESGTGKEKIAQLIHRASGRTGPFVAVNCAAVPDQLAESLLFGHAKGAFSGATDHQIGKLEQAHGGTLLLDELAELSLANQARLLRAVQDQIIEPVGSAKSKKIDCRIIAATNVNLQQAVAQKRFREDLYYRIAAAVIELPPLRARRGDIPKLALHFLDALNERYGFKRPRKFVPESLALLMSQDWPGNVRELAHVIENAAIQAANGKIEPKHLPSRRGGTSQALETLPDPYEGFSLDSFIGRIRGQLYERALALSDKNASKAAKLLGVTPQAVLKFMKGAGTTEVGKV